MAATIHIDLHFEFSSLRSFHSAQFAVYNLWTLRLQTLRGASNIDSNVTFESMAAAIEVTDAQFAAAFLFKEHINLYSLRLDLFKLRYAQFDYE